MQLSVIVFGALLVGLLAYGLVADNPRTTIAQGLADGKPVSAPAFMLPVLQQGDLGPRLARRLQPALRDGRLALEELKGTPVVLNFWASWCDPCREEMPLLQRTWRDEARAAGAVMVGIDMQDIRAEARAFLREFGASYLNLHDPTDGVARDYGVTGLPETFFIDRDGRVVDHVVGAVDARDLREGLTAARGGRVVGERDGGEQRTLR